MSPQRKALRVTLVYEYDVDPDDYPNGNDPYEMAVLDFEQDLAIKDSDWEIERAVFRAEQSS